MADTTGKLDLDRAEALEARYDPEMSFRPLSAIVRKLIYVTLVGLGIYHYYTAGFGIPREQWHKGIHMGLVLCMIFFVFAARRSSHEEPARNTWWCPGNVPLYDWVLGFAALISALYIPVTFTGVDVSIAGYHLVFEELNYRIGNPNSFDLFFGTVLCITIFEAARRAMGWVLPIIVGCFVVYSLYGSQAPLQVLVIPDVNWSQFLNHVYLTTEGIYGAPIKVISTFVFHFVLFGVIAQRMGLGQFFIDIAQIVAGRFAGGPAKVSVLSSSLFGTISGSSIANTVTTGSLTIPAMKRVGYPGHFAGAVEAASSTGGQITPPIMGAAAFLMVEFLELPYTTIIAAAAVPALMHYIAVFAIVHFEAKRLGLRGLSRDELPRLGRVLREGWPTIIPLVILITVLFSGYTPYYAAFSGITACIVIGFVNPRNRLTIRDLLDAFYMGSKYALAVGAAGAAVGIVVGVITLTGVTFRLGFMVTQGALGTAEVFHAAFAFLPFELFTIDGATLFVSLAYIAMACVLMGAGLPTTALYIMLSAIATPALGNLGVPPLAAHLFVLYYGVLADITPPVCTSAYAAGGIAGANPFRTGLTAFKLGNAKVMVPMVFVYSPAMLIVLDDYFTWNEFLLTTVTCIAGIVMLGAALVGFIVRPMAWFWRWLLAIASIAMVAPDPEANAWALALAAPVLLSQFIPWWRDRRQV
ncbi:MAG: TRAP transporter permease [Pseudomonadota bacterium]